MYGWIKIIVSVILFLALIMKENDPLVMRHIGSQLIFDRVGDFVQITSSFSNNLIETTFINSDTIDSTQSVEKFLYVIFLYYSRSLIEVPFYIIIRYLEIITKVRHTQKLANTRETFDRISSLQETYWCVFNS